MTVLKSTVRAGRTLDVTEAGTLEVNLLIAAHPGALSHGINVDKGQLAEALAEIGVPGLTYIKPVKLPTGIGAVIDRLPSQESFRHSPSRYMIRHANGSWYIGDYVYGDQDAEAEIRAGAIVVNEGVQGYE